MAGKVFEQTPDGRYFYRPYGRMGAVWELPGAAAFRNAKIVNYAILAIVIAVAVANVFHRNFAITMAALAVVAGLGVAWIELKKRGWKKAEPDAG